jgi:hypothetical protein
MDINDIGCSMINLSLVLGGKNGVFFTQEAQIFVDGLVSHGENGRTIAKI